MAKDGPEGKGRPKLPQSEWKSSRHYEGNTLFVRKSWYCARQPSQKGPRLILEVIQVIQDIQDIQDSGGSVQAVQWSSESTGRLLQDILPDSWCTAWFQYLPEPFLFSRQCAVCSRQCAGLHMLSMHWAGMVFNNNNTKRRHIRGHKRKETSQVTVEESSPKRIFSWNHVFSVFVCLQNKYFHKTMISVYLLVHQNKYLTRFSVYFVVHQNVYILANNSFWWTLLYILLECKE